MIRNLLFDLGGVIMDIKRDNCADAFRQLGMANPDEFLGKYSQSGPFAGIENGSVTVEGFHNDIRKIIGNNELSDKAIDDAFGKFLLGIPRRRLEDLRRLGAYYRLYLLSNTNPIMWADGIARAFAQEGGDVNTYFSGIVRSYDARVMKPDPEIFLYTQRRLGVVPQETLFLDDSQKNLDVAGRLGFMTLLVKPGEEFMALLRQYPGMNV